MKYIMSWEAKDISLIGFAESKSEKWLEEMITKYKTGLKNQKRVPVIKRYPRGHEVTCGCGYDGFGGPIMKYYPGRTGLEVDYREEAREIAVESVEE